MNAKVFFCLIFLFGITVNLYAQSIVNTKHNLSVSGTGDVKATSESEICLFCHTPHKSNPIAPLWNRKDPGMNYILYNSSTMQALPGQPDGSSILCLSCHDGTIAMGNVLSRSEEIRFGSISTMPNGKSNLTTDLRNDHPVSFVYNSSLSTIDGQIKSPTNISIPVTLENSKLQCTSCHDAHNNIYSDFLVNTTQYSMLCNSCHQRTNWNESSHSSSVKTWNGVAPDPWENTEWTTVAQNACENCHNTHNAGSDTRLMKYKQEENNCYECHNSNVASKNIQAQFAKTYRHNVSGYTGIHDPAESAIVTNTHVECVDCHNPHEANNFNALAPAVKGFNKGVMGINQNGSTINSVSYEYEICYRCHSVNAATPNSTARQIVQNNVSMQFAPGNPSFHAVASDGVNNNIPSLIAPYTTSSRLYCSDCHGSDMVGGPKGPHGSIYQNILKYQYVKANNTIESQANYQLCYSCHSRSSILGDNSFKKHKKHIVDEKTSCNVCHDAHGISSTQGNSFNNTNLINFQSSVVTNSSSGMLKFEDQGMYQGRCYLTCHGKNHNPLSY